MIRVNQSQPACWPAQALLMWVAENRAALARDDFARLARAFRALDPDRRGFLTLDQLRAALGGEAGALSAAELAGMTECARGGPSASLSAARAWQGERAHDCSLSLHGVVQQACLEYKGGSPASAHRVSWSGWCSLAA